MGYPKVVVIGGGFGGLSVVQSLKKAHMDVLLIDKTNHYLFQPLLYQVATAALSPADIAFTLRSILAKQKNAKVIMAQVTSINTEKNHIILEDGEIANYDYLVVAVGARHSYFGHTDWEEDAPGLKTLADAIKIRERILTSYEKAERCDSSTEALKYLQFAIVGGGPTGVELAGAIGEIAHQTMSKNFRNIRPEQTQIFLVEGLDRILPSYPLHLAERAKQDLEKMGVTVMTDQKVTSINAEGLMIGQAFIPARNIIWAAGNQASPLVKTLAAPLDHQGRVMVEEDLTIPGHSEVFVIGDCAHVKDKIGNILPGVAPVAVQQGRFVGNILIKKISKEKRKKFQYHDKGSLATIGRAKAVGFAGKFQFTGLVAWLFWSFIHIFYLITFRNRLLVMMQWTFWYFTGYRNVRLIQRGIDEFPWLWKSANPKGEPRKDE